MGLDMWLRKIGKTTKQKILNKLNDEDESVELMYWRKNWLIHEWFCDKFDVENCGNYSVTKEDLLNLIKYILENWKGSDYWLYEEEKEVNKDNQKLNKIVKETDWENEDVFYHAWW